MGELLVADMRRTGRPRTVRTDVPRAVFAQCLEDDRRWSLQELQAHTGIVEATVYKILREELQMVRLLQSGCRMQLLNNKKKTPYGLKVLFLETFPFLFESLY